MSSSARAEHRSPYDEREIGGGLVEFPHQDNGTPGAGNSIANQEDRILSVDSNSKHWTPVSLRGERDFVNQDDNNEDPRELLLTSDQDIFNGRNAFDDRQKLIPTDGESSLNSLTEKKIELHSIIRMTSSAATSPTYSSKQRLLFYAAGIFICYFYFGILQEKM